MSIQDKLGESLKAFQRFLDIVRGKEDPQTRPNLILNPSNVQTSANLTPEQLDFVSTSYFIADYFPEFTPLKDYARSFCLSSMSKGGWAIDKIIEFEQAMSEKNLLKYGLKTQPSITEKVKEVVKTNATKE